MEHLFWPLSADLHGLRACRALRPVTLLIADVAPVLRPTLSEDDFRGQCCGEVVKVFCKKVPILKIYKWSLLDKIKWTKFINKILRLRAENNLTTQELNSTALKDKSIIAVSSNFYSPFSLPPAKNPRARPSRARAI